MANERKRNIEKVYLDTNILIRGGKDKSHNDLKKLSKENKIILCKSIHGTIEQHAKVILALNQKNNVLRELDKAIFSNEYEEKFKKYTKTKEEYNDFRESEKIEKEYWEDVNLIKLSSSFNSLIISKCTIPDFNGELALFEELIKKYSLKEKDAFHVMNAYSSKIDYFLTWDRPLINKCKKINWLNMKIMTPEDFLETYP